MLAVRLWGGLDVTLDGVAVEAPTSRRAWGLLGWLALHPGLHPRGSVAARLWPDVFDASARASLRSAVWALRRALGPPVEGYLCATHDHLGLDPTGQVWVDVAAFDEHVAAGRLPEAAALAQGELLAGFDDEWALTAREEYHSKLADVLEALAAEAEAGGDLAVAVAWTRRQVALDPLAEQPQCRLMTRLAAAGDRAAALAGYGRFRERLARELRMVPSAATRRLAEDLGEAVEPPLRRPAAYSRRTLALVGRDRELGRLLAAWRDARSGAGAVVTVTGEPGMGKTRLVAELLERARADGARTACSAALDLGAGAPLAPWAELIGDLSVNLDAPPLDAAWPAALGVLAPDLERRLGRPPGVRLSVSPDLERARLFEATTGLLEWAARRPLVLALEDVHAADAASLELAGYVGRRAARLPVLLVLSRRLRPQRAEVDTLEHALRSRGVLTCEVSLRPLPATDVARLVRAVAALPDADVARVVAAADGNALLAVESARALARGEHEPPASLRGAVRAALAPLVPGARRLADLAAVAGRDVTIAEAEAAGVAAAVEAATAALESGLLVASGDRVGYHHALLREAAYHDLPEPARVSWHSAFAAALVAADDPAARFAAEAARHFRLAGRDDLAVAQLARAAAHARTVAALAEAAAFLTEAAELAPENADLLVELADAEAWRGRSDASDVAFARALELLGTGPPEELARAWTRQANWYRGAMCHPRRVLDSARRAIDVLDAAALGAPQQRIEGLSAWAWAEAVAGDADAAEALLKAVHEVLGPGTGGDLVTYWVGHARALALIRRGRFTESYAPGIAAGEACKRAHRPDLSYGCWANAACAAACAGDFPRALEFIDRGLAALAGSGLAAPEVHFLAGRAHVLVRLGRPEQARAASEAERALAERVEDPVMVATSEHDRGLIALALGDDAHAERLLAAALAHDAPVSRPLTRLARAEALVRLARYDDAESELRATALEPVRRSDMPDTLVPRLTRLQGLIAAGRGEPALATRRLREAASGWRALLGRGGEGDAYSAALADLGRPPVVGLVEPARELDRVEAELATLHPHSREDRGGPDAVLA